MGISIRLEPSNITDLRQYDKIISKVAKKLEIEEIYLPLKTADTLFPLAVLDEFIRNLKQTNDIKVSFWIDCFTDRTLKNKHLYSKTLNGNLNEPWICPVKASDDAYSFTLEDMENVTYIQYLESLIDKASQCDIERIELARLSKSS